MPQAKGTDTNKIWRVLEFSSKKRKQLRPKTFTLLLIDQIVLKITFNSNE